MALPTKVKTWQITANNRITFVSVPATNKDALFGIKQHIKGMTGITVKGSSDGTTAAMDAVDRWSSAAAIGTRVATTTTNNGSWIVLVSSVMGVEIAISYIGSTDGAARITFSVGGYTLAGTPTRHPTTAAMDEMGMKVGIGDVQNTGSELVGGSTSLDRLWSCGRASDGSAFWYLVVRSNALSDFGFMQTVVSAVVAPATFSPPVIGFDAQSTTNSSLSNGIFSTEIAGQGASARANNGVGGGDVHVNNTQFSIEGFSTVDSVVTRYTYQPELQGGGFLMSTWGVHSEDGVTRGKLGNVIDMWSGLTTATLGDTYPNDATRQFLALGGSAGVTIPWDGSVFVGA